MFRVLFSILLSLYLCFQFSAPVNAEEGGTGHYVPGSAATMIDVAPTQPGWIIQPLFLQYTADFDGSRTFPSAGLQSTGLDVSATSVTIGAVYSFENKVFGATYSAGLYVPFLWLDITGTVGGYSRSDSVSGLSDIAIIPAVLAWKTDNWQYDIAFPIYAPTGDYDLGQLANLGLNYWTFDPTVGAVYNNAKTGFNAAIHSGITFNTENEDTNYDSGSVWHTEVSVQQLLPLKAGFLGLGVNAFWYEQISDDSGSGALNGGFQGRSVGVGPVIDYILPTPDNGTFVFEFKWLPELETVNRVEGDYFWVKAAWQF